MVKRVRTREEVAEIKIREQIKLSLVLQQRGLNREIANGGCPTARGKVYITSIFQKDGQLNITRPQLCVECVIRAYLNQKDIRNRRRPRYDIKLVEEEIRKYCTVKNHKEKCPAYRRLLEETQNVIVKREFTV